MDTELNLLLGTAIDSLAKLEILLYFHGRPGAVQTADEVAARLHRPVNEVSAALAELSGAGLLDRFKLGSGRFVMYGPSEDDHVATIIGLLHERYHGDPSVRARIVAEAVRRSG